MAVKEKILKSSGKIIAEDVAEKTGKKVYDSKGTIAITFSILAAIAITYWVKKVREEE